MEIDDLNKEELISLKEKIECKINTLDTLKPGSCFESDSGFYLVLSVYVDMCHTLYCHKLRVTSVFNVINKDEKQSYLIQFKKIEFSKFISEYKKAIDDYNIVFDRYEQKK